MERCPVIGSFSTFGSKKKRPKKAKRAEGGTWRAFLDECPHRKVPLSEGRVEDDGTLLCSYHAWRFDGQGGLVHVPQLGEPEAVNKIRANPKSRCHSFPTQVLDGLLWVWAESGENAVLESALTPAHNFRVHEGVDDQRRWWQGRWNHRVLPYRADFFVENVMDPAHVPVSHHNLVGSRYHDQTLTLTAEKAVTKDGFVRRCTSALYPTQAYSLLSFQAPPTTVRNELFLEQGARQILEVHVTPAVPGFCHHMGRMVLIKDQQGRLPALFQPLTIPIPLWLKHVVAARFTNQDAGLVHQQERNIWPARENTYLTVRRAAICLIPAPRITWRRCSRSTRICASRPCALGGVDLGVVSSPTRTIIIAYHPWISNCVLINIKDTRIIVKFICQRTLANLKKIRLASLLTAAAWTVLRPWSNPWWNLAMVALTGTGGLVVNTLMGWFYWYEFSHAHND